MLEKLDRTIAKQVVGKRPQDGHVDENRPGLPERSRQVLAGCQVDARLPTHAGVHHRQQAGGEGVEVDAPHVGGCDETGEVGGYSAPQGDHGGVPPEACYGELLEKLAVDLHALAALTRGDFEQLAPGLAGLAASLGRAEAVEQLLSEQPAHVGVGYHRDVAAVQEFAELGKEVHAHRYRVGGCYANLKLLHARPTPTASGRSPRRRRWSCGRRWRL